MHILNNKPQTITSPSYTVWPWAIHTMSHLWEKPYMAAGKASSLRENVKMSTMVKHTNKNIHSCNWNSLYCGLKIWAVYQFSNLQWVSIHSQEKKPSIRYEKVSFQLQLTILRKCSPTTQRKEYGDSIFSVYLLELFILVRWDQNPEQQCLKGTCRCQLRQQYWD